MKEKKTNKVEILAPAGSYESFLAALKAGADAVYAGGPRFSARAFAGNFTEEELLQAIDYAHLHGRKFYLTVNTLVKEHEFADLYRYLEPLYLQGLDAVIVQDIGVLEGLRNCFPQLDIHASTQMTVTGAEGAEFLRRKGVVRVVTARELSLEEVRYIKRTVGIEIECFVHGALCYSYSGQCLMSSLIGGRSGNRGQCAQPCRLPYSAGGKKGYLLSMKDMCTLELLPELLDAGIDSLKIEGRMKRPEYVAGVTAMYRKYTDLYLENGRKDYQLAPRDRDFLLDLFNRGGFYDGYYHKHNGKEMLAIDRPSHAGVPVGIVLSQKGRKVTFKVISDIGKGDVIELPGGKENYTFGENQSKGAICSFLSGRGSVVLPDTVLYRIHNRQLLEELSHICHFEKIQEKIYGFLRLSPGKSATLLAGFQNQQVEVSSDMPVETASGCPLGEERIRKQMQKTGDTDFCFEHLEITAEGDIFLPIQQLNILRRRALEELRKEILRPYRRKKVMADPSFFGTKEQRKGEMGFSALAGKTQHLACLLDFPEISLIYVDSHMDGNLFQNKTALALCRKLRKNGRTVLIAMPHIFRKETKEQFEIYYKSGIFDEFDGVLARNYESIFFLMERDWKKEIILDYNLYVMNRSAEQFWKKEEISRFTVSPELNRKELAELDLWQAELIVYGYLPVMLSAQCLAGMLDGCRRTPKTKKLSDRRGNVFTVENLCRDCYNIIYNSVPLCLFGQKEAIRQLSPAGIRLQFSFEEEREVRSVLEEFRHVFRENNVWSPWENGFTKGHFARGIT